MMLAELSVALVKRQVPEHWRRYRSWVYWTKMQVMEALGRQWRETRGLLVWRLCDAA